MAKFKIGVSAGHGMYTVGKRTIQTPPTPEWVLNNAVVLRIVEYLKEYDVEIFRYDDPTGQKDISLRTRGPKAIGDNLDLYLSIHHNAAGGTGPETIGPLNGSMDKLGELVSKSISEAIGLYDRGVKHFEHPDYPGRDKAYINRYFNDYGVDNLIIEVGFMDTWKDLDIITTPEGQDKAAKAIVDTISEFYGLSYLPSVNPELLYPGLNTLDCDGVPVHVYLQKDNEVLDTYTLPEWKDKKDITDFMLEDITCAVNRSYFIMEGAESGQVIGRDQSTYTGRDDRPNMDGWLDTIISKNFDVLSGDYQSWDHLLKDILCGTSCSSVLVKDGKFVEITSKKTAGLQNKKYTQTFMAKFKNGKFALGLATGLVYPKRVREILNQFGGGLEHLSFYDNGGSTQGICLDRGGKPVVLRDTDRLIPNVWIFRKVEPVVEPVEPIEPEKPVEPSEPAEPIEPPVTEPDNRKVDKWPYKVHLGGFDKEKDAQDYASLIKRTHDLNAKVIKIDNYTKIEREGE